MYEYTSYLYIKILRYKSVLFWHFEIQNDIVCNSKFELLFQTFVRTKLNYRIENSLVTC